MSIRMRYFNCVFGWKFDVEMSNLYSIFWWSILMFSSRSSQTHTNICMNHQSSFQTSVVYHYNRGSWFSNLSSNLSYHLIRLRPDQLIFASFINMTSLLQLCALSSLCGALGSVSAKLAFDDAFINRLIHKLFAIVGMSIDQTTRSSNLTNNVPNNDIFNATVDQTIDSTTNQSMYVYSLTWCIRISLIGVMLALNSAGLTLMLRAMHRSSTNLAVAINQAISFMLSGLIGWLVFDESIDQMWLIGVSIVCVGVALLTSTQQETSIKAD